MTRLSAFVATSIDGYIATSEGSLDWLERAARPDEDYGFDDFLARWMPWPWAAAPTTTSPTWTRCRSASDRCSSSPTVRRHREPGSPSGTSTLEQARAHWTDQGFDRVYVDGGRVISDFLAEGLIDDLILTAAPILLGSGRPLFHPGARRPTSSWTACGPGPAGS